jgi:predicted methyltransferase
MCSDNVAGSAKASVGPWIAIVAIALGCTVLNSQQQARPRSREFPPEELGTLGPPDRDEWQQPEKIMDALGIYDGNRVADLGAGSGWFTVRLARRVGPNGRVYAEDIKQEMLESIKNAAAREGLSNIQILLGTKLDPRLPSGLNAVLMVGVFRFLEDPRAILRKVAESLAPTGRVGIVEYKKDGAGGPGPDLDERIDPEVIVRDAAAAGLHLRSHETFLRYQYLLVFGVDGRKGRL